MRRISLAWVILLALVWAVLAAPRFDAWGAGLLAVVCAAALHTGLGGRRGGLISPLGFAAFVPFFLDQSVRGGVDVARRAFTPSLPLEPGFLDYTLRLPEGPARVFFVNCISLLPGTFSADLAGGRVRVHLLAEPQEGPRRLARLEGRVAALFGVPLGGEEAQEARDG